MAEIDETRAIAKLPGLDVEIRHGRAVGEDVEFLAISLRAAPSFAAMGEYLRSLDGAFFNPFLPWLPAVQLARAFWAPWLGAAALPPPNPPGETKN
jgi:hypothetical protein